jgi:hypothetical protein
MICPVCIATAAVVATSAGSGGGISAAMWRILRKKRGGTKLDAGEERTRLRAVANSGLRAVDLPDKQAGAENR